MKNILLVEDDPFLIDVYSIKLKNEGFSVEIAENGPKALSLLEQKKIDLILLDIVLPQADGWEVLFNIKKNEKIKGIPVIILSNLGQKTEVEKGLKLGAVKYLIKAHYKPTDVIKEVKKVLK